MSDYLWLGRSSLFFQSALRPRNITSRIRPKRKAGSGVPLAAELLSMIKRTLRSGDSEFTQGIYGFQVERRRMTK